MLLEQEVSRRVAAELATRASLRDDALKSQLEQLGDALERKTSETMRLRDELERAHADAAAATASPGPHAAHEAAVVASMAAALSAKEDALATLQAQNASLLQNVTALQMRVQSGQSQLAQAQAQAAAVAAAGPTGASGGSGAAGGSAADSAENRLLKDNLSSLKRKYDVQLQERAALKVILEKKMKALIDSIAAAALHGKGAAPAPGSSPTGSPDAASAAKDVLPARTRREIEVLQRLVEASLTALKNSDSGHEAPQQSPPPQQQSPPPSSQQHAQMQHHAAGDRDVAAGPSRLAPVFASSPSPPLSHPHAHPLASSAPRSLSYGPGSHPSAIGSYGYAPSASPPPPPASVALQGYVPQQHQQQQQHHAPHYAAHGGHHGLASLQQHQQQQPQHGRPSPLPSPHLSASHPRAASSSSSSSSSLTGDAAQSIDGIERLIAQRKEELQRLDERLR